MATAPEVLELPREGTDTFLPTQGDGPQPSLQLGKAPFFLPMHRGGAAALPRLPPPNQPCDHEDKEQVAATWEWEQEPLLTRQLQLPITLEITPRQATAGNPDETWLGTVRKAQEVNGESLGPRDGREDRSRKAPAERHNYPSTCTLLKNKPHESRGKS